MVLATAACLCRGCEISSKPMHNSGIRVVIEAVEVSSYRPVLSADFLLMGCGARRLRILSTFL